MHRPAPVRRQGTGLSLPFTCADAADLASFQSGTTVQLAQARSRLPAGTGQLGSAIWCWFPVPLGPTWGSSVLPSGSYTVLCTLRSQQGRAERAQHAVGRIGWTLRGCHRRAAAGAGGPPSASKHGQHQAAPGTTLLFVFPPAGCHSHLQCGFHGQVALRVGVEGLGVIGRVLRAGREGEGIGGDAMLTTCRPLPPDETLQQRVGLSLQVCKVQLVMHMCGSP